MTALEERFWAKVAIPADVITGCWLWTANRRNGYGGFQVGGRSINAHRVSYTLVKGEIPAGLDVDHLCRNRGCVNPHHLEAVTRAENIRRAAAGPLWTRGERNGNSSLPEWAAQEVIDLGRCFTQLQIAQMYGISRSQVGRIVRREQWQHLAN